MKFFDLVALIMENLGRRKARVALTAIGVVIGTAAVVILVSLGIGLQASFNQNLYGIGDLTQIQVYPGFPTSEVAVVGGGGGGGGFPGESEMTLITDQSLQDFATLAGVTAVIPRVYGEFGYNLEYNRLYGGASINGAGTDDLSNLGLNAQQGTTELARGTAVIGSQVSMNFYDPNYRPGQEPPPPPDLMGQTVKLVMMRWNQDGTETRKTVQLRITGVLAESQTDADWTVFMTLDEITKYNEWYRGKRIDYQREGYNWVIVKVSDTDHTSDVAETITSWGYQAYTPQTYLEGINSFYVILQVIFGGVGAIALLVAAIGIANTMAMAILERTREIGLMKAVGATNREVLSIFLGEAAGIGFIGGLGGVIIGWSLGQIINVLALVYFAGQVSEGGALPSIAVVTPAWLLIFSLVFATLVGLLSGVYPALRAATLVPVTALKYE